jgi:hypothetical protein
MTPLTLVEKAPKTIKVFVNMPNTPSFEEAEEAKETETLTLTAESFSDLIPLRYVKYQNVHSLQLFVVDNLGDAATTVIERLVIIGTPLEGTNMSDLKKVEDH